MLSDLYPPVETNKDGRMVDECPECGKEVIITGIGKVSFCSMMCETNYRYRMKNKDSWGHTSKTPDDVKKL